MTKPFKIFLAALAVVLGLVTFAAKADDTITWVHPTQYVADSVTGISDPLDPADISETIIRYGVGTSANPPTVLTSISVPAPATSVVVPRDPKLAGTVCYQAATLMKAEAGGLQSTFAPAAWVCKTQSARKPKPPTGLKAQ